MVCMHDRAKKISTNSGFAHHEGNGERKGDDELVYVWASERNGSQQLRSNKKPLIITRRKIPQTKKKQACIEHSFIPQREKLRGKAYDANKTASSNALQDIHRSLRTTVRALSIAMRPPIMSAYVTQKMVRYRIIIVGLEGKSVLPFLSFPPFPFPPPASLFKTASGGHAFHHGPQWINM